MALSCYFSSSSPLQAMGIKKQCTQLAKAHWANPIHHIARGGHFVKNTWKDFRAEVEMYGKSRYLWALKQKVSKKQRAFQYFIDPFIEIPYDIINFTRVKAFNKKPFLLQPALIPHSLTSAVTWGGITLALISSASSKARNELIQAATNDYAGAEDILQWVNADNITEQEAIEMLYQQEKGLTAPHLTVLEPRLNTLIQLGVIDESEKQNLKRFIQIALPLSLKDGRVVNAKFDSQLLALIEQAKKPKEWKKPLSEFDKFYLSYLLSPQMYINDKPELHWLSFLIDPEKQRDLSEDQQKAMQSLTHIYDYHNEGLPLPKFIQFIADSLTKDKMIQQKVLKARSMGLLERMGNTPYRVDLPAISGELDFLIPEAPRHMTDELDRWDLLLNYHQFAQLKESYFNNEISEYYAIYLVTSYVAIYNQLYELYGLLENNQHLNSHQLCTAIYGSTETLPIALFKPYAPLMSDPNLAQHSTATKSLLLFSLVNNYYEHIIATATIQDVKKLNILNSKYNENELLIYEALEKNTLQDYIKKRWNESVIPCTPL